MIPKKIHYCWFGGNPLPELAQRCIASWKKYCPDYEIVEWNENNFDVNCNQYCAEAYANKKWAFVSDYARLKILYDNGGVYFDTDVELIKPLDDLMDAAGFMGFEDSGSVNTGLGFACEKENAVVGAMLKDYDGVPFIKADGSFDITPCPSRNTDSLIKLGMDITNKGQVFMGIKMLDEDYLCPIKYSAGEKIITENTYSIHHFDGSWLSEEDKYMAKVRNRYRKFLPYSLASYLARFVSYIKYRGFFGAVKETVSWIKKKKG